jgi:hypothetical protein
VKQCYVNPSRLGATCSARKRGSFRKSLRRHKTPPNKERAWSGMRRTPSKSPAPNVRAGSRMRVCSFVHSSRPGISILRIVTGLLLLLAFAFCGWLYFSRRSAAGLPAGLLVYDEGRQHLQRTLVTPSASLRPPRLPDRDDRRPGPCRAQVRRASPVWTAYRSCGVRADAKRQQVGRRRSRRFGQGDAWLSRN